MATLVSPAWAEKEDGLYGAMVPQDAVFVRAVGEMPEQITVFGRNLPADVFADGGFVAFDPDTLRGAMARGHYSLTQTDGAVSVIAEPSRAGASKVTLTVINFGAGAADLKVAQGGPVVIDDVAPGDTKTRGVNPVAVTLEAQTDGQAKPFDLVLRRKQNITFVIDAKGEILLVEDRYGAVFAEDAQ